MTKKKSKNEEYKVFHYGPNGEMVWDSPKEALAAKRRGIELDWLCGGLYSKDPTAYCLANMTPVEECITSNGVERMEHFREKPNGKRHHPNCPYNKESYIRTPIISKDSKKLNVTQLFESMMASSAGNEQPKKTKGEPINPNQDDNEMNEGEETISQREFVSPRSLNDIYSLHIGGFYDSDDPNCKVITGDDRAVEEVILDENTENIYLIRGNAVSGPMITLAKLFGDTDIISKVNKSLGWGWILTYPAMEGGKSQLLFWLKIEGNLREEIFKKLKDQASTGRRFLLLCKWKEVSKVAGFRVATGVVKSPKQIEVLKED